MQKSFVDKNLGMFLQESSQFRIKVLRPNSPNTVLAASVNTFTVLSTLWVMFGNIGNSMCQFFQL